MASAEKELEKVREEFIAFDKRLFHKVDVEEANRIWDNFQKYAMYDDLKDLYTKTIPEIKRFEDKIVEFSIEQEKTEIIVRRFDEIMSEKASKIYLKDVAKNMS